MKLNPDSVPPGLWPLLSMAERWGITDDGDREEAVDDATVEELRQLVNRYGRVDVDELFAWLAGPVADKGPPSPEYCASTCLTMAVDLAKIELNTRRSRGGAGS